MSQNHEVLPYVTGIVQDYGNCDTDYIANGISPKVKVDRREFTYREFDATKPFNAPPSAAMEVGDYAQVVEISANTSTLSTDMTIDRGLENPIDWHTFSESGQPCSGLDTDVTARHAIYLMHKYMLDREIRVKDLTTDETLYTTGNDHDQGGAAIGDGTGGTVDPLDMIAGAMEDALVQPNKIWMSEKIWWTIRRQNSINGSTFSRGLASKEAFAAIFGFAEVLVGPAWVIDSGSGLRVRVWPDDKIVLGYVDQTFDNPNCPRATYSFSASVDGDVLTQAWEDKTIGLRGGVRVRVGEGIKEEFFYTQGQIIYNFTL